MLGITINNQTKNQNLEKVVKFIKKPNGFFHLVSVNPENLVICQENKQAKEVFNKAQIRLNDGVGIVIAAFLLGIPNVSRTSGVDFMLDLLKLANERRLRVMLIGGGAKIADKVVECQREKFPQIKFFSLMGIKEINRPKKEEEEKIFSIVSSFKPHLVFVAFGSPFQELWLYKNRERFDGVVVMGVGGGFDYLAGVVPRAPLFLRRLGLEWFFRLMVQPWRWRRQLRLLKFVWLLTKEEIILKVIKRKTFGET